MSRSGCRRAADRRSQCAGRPLPRGCSIEREPLLIVQNVSKQFGGTQALNHVGIACQRRRDRRAPRRERSRQIDPHQDPRRASTRSTRAPVTYRGRDASSSSGAADSLHPSGSRPDRLDDRCGEHLPDARLSAPRRNGGLEGRTQARRSGARILGADIDPDVRIQSLTRTEKSLVAIARALAAEAEILVLDEPTASLPGRRGRAPLHGAAASPRARRRHDLRLAPARRGVRYRRPHGRPARRPRRRRAPA